MWGSWWRDLLLGLAAGLVLTWVALIVMLTVAHPWTWYPDFIPVLGFADDAVMVILVLRWTVRHATLAAVRHQWPGSRKASRPWAA